MISQLKAVALALATLLVLTATANAQDKPKQDKPQALLGAAEVKPGTTYTPFPAENGWKTWGPLSWGLSGAGRPG